jgi:hypothetical protein
MKTEITISIDTDALNNTTDEHLVCLWAVAQANPAADESNESGAITEQVGREIIKRFIARTGLPLWQSTGSHYYWNELRKLGKWVNDEFVPHVVPVADQVPEVAP